MVEYKTVRFEITEHYLRDGEPGSDTTVLYPPIDKYWQQRDTQRIIDENGRSEFIPTGYQCIQLAGFFKYPEHMDRSPTPEEIEACKKRWGESPYKHYCYEQNGKSICKENYTVSYAVGSYPIDLVNCVDCLRVLIKASAFVNPNLF